MTAVGLDSRGRATLAVFVDEEGRVLSRTIHEGLSAEEAAKTATHEGQPADVIGIVSRDDEAAANGRIALVNPGAAIALAEQWSGAAKGARHVVGLSIGPGVHAGVVVDGKLFGGAHGLAGSAAWLALNPVEREDYRKLGCLEAEVGEPGIVRRIVWRIKAGDHSRVLDMAGGNINAITALQVFEAARANDGVAVSVVRDTAKYIGMAAANLVAILDPDVVVLGGSIADAGDLLLEPSRTEMVRRVPPAVAPQLSFVPVALGDASAAIGAARAAMIASR